MFSSNDSYVGCVCVFIYILFVYSTLISQFITLYSTNIHTHELHVDNSLDYLRAHYYFIKPHFCVDLFYDFLFFVADSHF